MGVLAAVQQGHVLGVVALAMAACGGGSTSSSSTEAPGSAAITSANPSCPASAPAAALLPHVQASHRTLAYWLEHTPDLDDVLLDVDRIHDMNASLEVERGPDWHGEQDLAAPIDQKHLVKDLEERLAAMHVKLKTGDFLERDGTPMKPADIAAFDPARVTAMTFAPELRVTLDPLPIRCGPRAVGYFSKPTPAGAPLNTRFDRNNCSTAHPQEVVQILAKWPNGMRFARTRYASGWIGPDAKLSPPIPEALRETYLHGPRGQADEELALKATGSAGTCPAGTLLPVGGKSQQHVYFADATGFHDTDIADGRLQPTRRPLTRRALLTEAFRFLDTPYGWGGAGAGHDCSSFLMDLFNSFDLHLPRHSAWQARAGTFSIDVTKVAALDERVRLIDSAATKGVVLLGFPGHIMLYLGRNETGAPMVLHAIAEYVVPCPGGGETINQIDKVTVSDLELGKGSSRKSLLERITTVTVIGKAPGVELAGAAELRPAAPITRPDPKTCRDSEDVAIFSSPRTPNPKQPVRVIVTSSRDPGVAQLALFDPQGERVTPSSMVRLAGGPPWSVVATVDAPAAGQWIAVLGDGARVDACKKISVAKTKPGKLGARDPTAPVWDLRRAWGRATENLYATFVQRLFDFPPDQDLTWPDLHTLLKDPSRNLLFNHLQGDEEVVLKLKPDCADLPYLLRAYFAWKLGLPFAYHTCARGTASRAPSCRKTFATNLMIRDYVDDKPPSDPDAELATPDEPIAEREETDGIEETKIGDIQAFAVFWGRQVANAVHAASGRTVPDDENTDYYPVALSRQSLRPGTVYIDPFGHVMVIAAWVPQSATSYGMLLAADAQPDGTVGRKRFWRGNFLFSTDTKFSGAGFKAFRPALYSYSKKAIELMDNKALKRTRAFTPFSRQQYDGSVDAFYDTTETLINPRPLDPFAALAVLVDSLHSQTKLRVVSVKNGEDWAAANPGKAMAMPDGANIFLAAGPWEDFATPSRDFRLLIAIDTVMSFPASVQRAPARFALEPGPKLDATVKKLEAELAKGLASRSIEYVRSDGKSQTVTLQQLVDRKAGFEISYNPNDCAELRWGAVEGTPEFASCKRHAPADQRAKLNEYRTWFHDRRRPAR
ncbi:MAG: NlpC/P60 family protein [Kofleriaceae bacterium]